MHPFILWLFLPCIYFSIPTIGYEPHDVAISRPENPGQTPSAPTKQNEFQFYEWKANNETEEKKKQIYVLKMQTALNK